MELTELVVSRIKIKPPKIADIGTEEVATIIVALSLIVSISGGVAWGLFSLVVLTLATLAYSFIEDIWDQPEIEDVVVDVANSQIVEPEIVDKPAPKVKPAPKLNLSQKMSYPLGYYNDTYLTIPIDVLYNMLILGVTRYGKTSKIYEIVNWLIEHNSDEEIQFGFSDAKGLSFNIFDRLPHTRWPIANNVEETDWLLDEAMRVMHNRKDMFTGIQDRICTTTKDYEELTGIRLPYIVLILDEIQDSIPYKSEAEAKLRELAKKGLAHGIFLILATQRPTRESLSHEIQSQCVTKMSTYMLNAFEYKVANIPTYANLPVRTNPEKGKFVLGTPELVAYFTHHQPELEGWGVVQAPFIDKTVIEKAVTKYPPCKHSWREWGYGVAIDDVTLPDWGGSAQNKIRAISVLGKFLGAYPTKEQVAEQFDITPETAKKWLEKTY